MRRKQVLFETYKFIFLNQVNLPVRNFVYYHKLE